MKKIPYGRHHITGSDIRAVKKILKSDFLTQGPAVQSFEKTFARYIGVSYAVAVCNGTAALHLAQCAAGTTDKSAVLTTPLTFAATANSALYCGATIDFVDIDPHTLCVDTEKLRERIASAGDKNYTAVLPVSLAGYPVNTEKIAEICSPKNITIIEDACHAPGAYFYDSQGKVQNSGSCRFTRTAVFSFHPVKHIAAGEGGMITTNDKSVYEKLTLLRTHGITKDSAMLEENHGPWYYEMQELGYNYRMNDIQAALGNSQLKRAQKNLEKRRSLAHRYNSAFADSPVTVPKSNYHEGHAFHLYIIRIANRDEVFMQLRRAGILCQIHYIPLHMMPYYKKMGFRRGMYPEAEKYYNEALSLPLYPSLGRKDQDRVIDLVLQSAQ
jgi:UDP-4-amino-4,6-dideoxy-N-acetyl-beta-L-altrosamine transaminase